MSRDCDSFNLSFHPQNQKQTIISTFTALIQVALRIINLPFFRSLFKLYCLYDRQDNALHYRKIFSKVPVRHEKCLQASSSVKRKSLSTLTSGRDCTKSYTANVGGDRINPEIRILHLPNVNGFSEGG